MRDDNTIIIDNSEHIKFSYVHKENGNIINFPIPPDPENYYKVPVVTVSMSGKSWNDKNKKWEDNSEKQDKITKLTRERLYRDEADKLYMHWIKEVELTGKEQPELRQIWIDKVTEIKAQNPLIKGKK